MSSMLSSILRGAGNIRTSILDAIARLCQALPDFAKLCQALLPSARLISWQRTKLRPSCVHMNSWVHQLQPSHTIMACAALICPIFIINMSILRIGVTTSLSWRKTAFFKPAYVKYFRSSAKLKSLQKSMQWDSPSGKFMKSTQGNMQFSQGNSLFAEIFQGERHCPNMLKVNHVSTAADFCLPTSSVAFCQVLHSQYLYQETAWPHTLYHICQACIHKYKHICPFSLQIFQTTTQCQRCSEPILQVTSLRMRKRDLPMTWVLYITRRQRHFVFLYTILILWLISLWLEVADAFKYSNTFTANDLA